MTKAKWKKAGARWFGTIEVQGVTMSAEIQVEDGFLGRRFGGWVNQNRAGSSGTLAGIKSIIVENCEASVRRGKVPSGAGEKPVERSKLEADLKALEAKLRKIEKSGPGAAMLATATASKIRAARRKLAEF